VACEEQSDVSSVDNSSTSQRLTFGGDVRFCWSRLCRSQLTRWMSARWLTSSWWS